ncbi:MAG TPA: hypothetical protein VM487_18565 [Phycisphaerae bacterium]|nr:hypothetical protein [Phycisphaerae bacterium]
MAIDYTASGPFGELGQIVYLYLRLRAEVVETGFGTAPSRFDSFDSILSAANALLDDDDHDRAVQAKVAATVEALKAQCDAWLVDIKSLGDLWLLERVATDLPATGASAEEILDQLIRDMRDEGETVLGNTIAVTGPTAWAGNTGDGAAVVFYLDQDRQTSQLIGNETFKLECTSDEADGTSAGEERFSIAGQPTAIDGLGNAGETLDVCNTTDYAAAAPSEGNRVNNGSFETWAAGDPSGWTVAAGDGLQSEESVEVYLDDASLEIAGDGAEAVFDLTQVVGALDVPLKPNTPYALHAAIKTSGVTQGTIEVYLAGTDYGPAATEKISIAAAWPAAWSQQTAVLRLPKTIPADLTLHVKISGTLNSGGVVWLDHVALVEMTPFVEAGIFFAVFRGQADFVAGLDPDGFDLVCTNSEDARFARFFREAYKVAMPWGTLGSNTISDDLTWSA